MELDQTCVDTNRQDHILDGALIDDDCLEAGIGAAVTFQMRTQRGSIDPYLALLRLTGANFRPGTDPRDVRHRRSFSRRNGTDWPPRNVALDMQSDLWIPQH